MDVDEPVWLIAVADVADVGRIRQRLEGDGSIVDAHFPAILGDEFVLAGVIADRPGHGADQVKPFGILGEGVIPMIQQPVGFVDRAEKIRRWDAAIGELVKPCDLSICRAGSVWQIDEVSCDLGVVSQNAEGKVIGVVKVAVVGQLLVSPPLAVFGDVIGCRNRANVVDEWDTLIGVGDHDQQLLVDDGAVAVDGPDGGLGLAVHAHHDLGDVDFFAHEEIDAGFAVGFGLSLVGGGEPDDHDDSEKEFYEMGVHGFLL